MVPTNFVRVRGRRFIDPAGRELLLNAINVFHDSAPADLQWVKTWGFNAMRVGFFWSDLEPEPGRINQRALDELAALVARAGELGLYVILDMHQDLWAAKPEDEVGRGAPPWTWAGNDCPHSHQPDGVWSMAYFESDKIQSQFDRFWANAPTLDGLGLMDHWLNVWKAVAQCFAGAPHVIGYDLFNEPFWGSRVVEAMQPMTLAMLPWLVAEHGFKVLQKPPFELALLGMQKAQSSPARYGLWLKAGRAAARRLDRELLAPAWDRAAQVIGSVDPQHIIFSSPTLPANFGLEAGIRPVQGALPYVYSAHAYDDDPRRMQQIIGHIIAHARAMPAPLFLGEWGNLTNGDHIFAGDPREATRVMLAALEAAGASHAYWHYLDAREQFDWFDEFLQRPYPARLAGELQACRFDAASGEFTCSWLEDPAIQAPSQFYIPARAYPNGYRVELADARPADCFEPAWSATPNGFYHVHSTGQRVRRTICIRRAS
jgi:endoglycosylceramidase